MNTVTISIERFKELELKEQVLTDSKSFIFKDEWGNFYVIFKGDNDSVINELNKKYNDIITQNNSLIERNRCLRDCIDEFNNHWVVRLFRINIEL